MLLIWEPTKCATLYHKEIKFAFTQLYATIPIIMAKSIVSKGCLDANCGASDIIIVKIKQY